MKTIDEIQFIPVSERKLKRAVGSNQYKEVYQPRRIRKTQRKAPQWYKSCWMTIIVLPVFFTIAYTVEHTTFRFPPIVHAQDVEIISPLAKVSSTPKKMANSHNVVAVANVQTQEPTITPATTTPEQKEIASYIKQVFGKDAPKAFKLLSCENSTYNASAVNTFGNYPKGSKDVGVFMINEYYQKTQAKFLFNYKINIEIAHQLYTENGNSFKLWTCGRKMEI